MPLARLQAKSREARALVVLRAAACCCKKASFNINSLLLSVGANYKIYPLKKRKQKKAIVVLRTQKLNKIGE